MHSLFTDTSVTHNKFKYTSMFSDAGAKKQYLLSKKKKINDLLITSRITGHRCLSKAMIFLNNLCFTIFFLMCIKHLCVCVCFKYSERTTNLYNGSPDIHSFLRNVPFSPSRLFYCFTLFIGLCAVLDVPIRCSVIQ